MDIGGTFTDVALAVGDRNVTSKVLTTATAPEEGVMTGIVQVIASAGVSPGDVAVVIHGTTLATNALIERRGASTAFAAPSKSAAVSASVPSRSKIAPRICPIAPVTFLPRHFVIS